MSYNIELSAHFKREAKKLNKKYPSLKADLAALFIELKKNHILGTALGNDVYKIRISIASKNKGKSGGARVISFVKIINETIYLLSIYNKSERDSISDYEIAEILKEYL